MSRSTNPRNSLIKNFFLHFSELTLLEMCLKNDATETGPLGEGGLRVADQTSDTGRTAGFFFFSITNGWSDLGHAT